VCRSIPIGLIWVTYVAASDTTALMRAFPTVAQGPKDSTHVKRLQALLAIYGHHLDPDGDFGRATKAAFAAWMTSVKRPSGGQVEASDWSVLLHGRNVRA
jgi:hypothetical protein